MSSRDKKNTQRVQAEFEFSNVGAHRGRRDREREREPPPSTIQPRTVRRREAFGTHLTGSGLASSGAQTPQSGPSRRGSPSPQRSGEDVDPVVAQ
jgi:hypothetical protein